MSGKRPQISITIDPMVLKRIDRASKKIGVSRSRFLEDAAKAVLEDAEAYAKLAGNATIMQAFAQAMTQPGVLGAFSSALSADLSEAEHQQLLEFLGKAPTTKSENRKR